MTLRSALVEAAYLAASALFIFGLKGLTRPDTARRGMRLAAVGMLVAVVGTLLKHEIVSYGFIGAGLLLGTAIGWPLGTRVPMTAMPQRIAISHLFGALAATLVGISEFYTHGHAITHAQMGALGFEVLFGALTISGSFMAFAKLHELLPGRPLTFFGQNAVSVLLLGSTAVMMGWAVLEPGNPLPFYAMVALAFISGFAMVLPIGGADMPVVVSLLNSYAGLAASATGFAIGNNVLIICGALDGASGFILSILMSRAMNRSFANVLFGAFGNVKAGKPQTGPQREMKAIAPEDAAAVLAYAARVVVVPGYGLAVAQAQGLVRELAEQIERRGGDVKYAIHPVAGRMPGHMNVLLAEANVAYEKMLELEEVNEQLPEVDVAIVIGANDVCNPAARRQKDSPIFGMPILNVDAAKRVIVLKRGQGKGFAGIDNELFYEEKSSILFGDAKATLQRLITEMKSL
jgi:NAD(P) transhydrogenase subunit beta